MSDHASGLSQVLGHAHFLDLLGDAYHGLGRYDEAIVAFSEAAAEFRRHGAMSAHAVCQHKIAQSQLALGRGERAIGYPEEGPGSAAAGQKRTDMNVSTSVKPTRR